ncbi:MAG: hypothetical protein ACFFAD_11430 [Candidatus Hermodarchaeota archaeon]
MQVIKAIREFLLGVWESQKASLAGPLIKTKVHLDDAMMLVILGELLGYPFQSTFYSRLFFVHLLEELTPWKRRLLREQDVILCMED